jgi:hypothetical protein
MAPSRPSLQACARKLGPSLATCSLYYRAIYDRLRHEGFVAGEGPQGYWANVRSAIKRVRNKFRTFDPAFDEIENYVGFRIWAQTRLTRRSNVLPWGCDDARVRLIR